MARVRPTLFCSYCPPRERHEWRSSAALLKHSFDAHDGQVVLVVQLEQLAGQLAGADEAARLLRVGGYEATYPAAIGCAFCHHLKHDGEHSFYRHQGQVPIALKVKRLGEVYAAAQALRRAGFTVTYPAPGHKRRRDPEIRRLLTGIGKPPTPHSSGPLG